MSPSSRVPYGVLLTYAGQVAGAFMTWGSLPTDARLSTSLRTMLPIPMREGTIDITSWNFDINLCGVLFPNWGPLLAGLFLVAFLALRSFGLWTAPKLVSGALVGYGLIHLGLLGAAFVDYGEVGAGCLVSSGCFLMLSCTTGWGIVLDVRRHLDEVHAAKAAHRPQRVTYSR